MILATSADIFGEHAIGLDECMTSVGVKTILSFPAKTTNEVPTEVFIILSCKLMLHLIISTTYTRLIIPFPI